LSEVKKNAVSDQCNDQDKKLPSVTIGIPVFNEEKHIKRVVEGFLSTNYPNLIEILIADGRSTDKTREIVAELTAKDPRVKLVDNPEKFQSYGLNHMIEAAEGEVFLRADGHCIYEDNYVEKCIEVLLSTGARNVGGAQRYKAKNLVQSGIAIAVKSYIGNGGAKYMRTDYEGYADTVFLGCFWTNDLRKLGGFNTENITNQDAELNLRLIEEFGDCVYVSPDIKGWYFPRNSFWKLFKQYFRYGRGRLLTKMFHRSRSPIRGMAPFLFIFSYFIFFLADIYTEFNAHSVIIGLILFLILIFESVRIVRKTDYHFQNEIWDAKDKEPSKLDRTVATTMSLAIMQIAHFSGFLYQSLKFFILRRKEW
jgi:glycosyltransferase involved in cell wall biosynthesis